MEEFEKVLWTTPELLIITKEELAERIIADARSGGGCGICGCGCGMHCYGNGCVSYGV